MLDEFIHESRIAYFSMEIALRNEIPTYAGGLGNARRRYHCARPPTSICRWWRSAWQAMPAISARKLMRRGGRWNMLRLGISGAGRRPLDAKIAVQIDGRTVWIGAWLYVLESHMGGRQPVLLLDTDLDENSSNDREITHYLYGGDNVYRLKQEIVLGLGGVRLLHAIGFTIRHYHMNEGHSALLGLELMRRFTYSTEHAASRRIALRSSARARPVQLHHTHAGRGRA